MNKRVLLICTAVAFFCLVSNSVAVENALGIKGGIGLNNVYGDGTDLLETSPSLGFAGGAFYELGISDPFSIQFEVLFSMKGYKFEVPDLGFSNVYGFDSDFDFDFDSDFDSDFDMGMGMDGEFTIRMNYLEIPVLFKFNIPTTGAMTPFLYAGPSFGFLLSSKVVFDGESEDAEGHSSFDLSIPVGAGFQVDAGPGRFITDARFSLGLLNTSDEDESDDYPVKNMQLFNIMVGYALLF
ncbi:porin family protein [Chitinispirillales bacterium ANBcel5]|uniref:porin family protein n=1 Tax=Cellulosispirillum alkaliphilum TaxID=3039283 RepID=UPI002A55AC39|nr:porin family protein [Chitinispirillales bacterium ANBcel5]